MSDSNGNRTSIQENEPHPRPIHQFISPALQINTYYNQHPDVLYQHLGDELQSLAGSINYKSGVIVNTVPLAFMRLNLMPGEIASIIANSIDIKFILQYAMRRNRPFGICHKINENMRSYGVLAAIYNHSLIKESIATESYEVKVRGFQLFEILHVKSYPDSDNQTLALARVKIIPNKTLNHPNNEICLHPNRYKSSLKFHTINRFQSQWPSWVYKQFDIHELASRLFKKVKILYDDIKISNVPSILSFQVTKLGIFTHEEVNELLGIESTNLRLQYELEYFNRNQSMQKLRCTKAKCGITISNMSCVLPISPEGKEDSYCGSWGSLHSLITVTHLEDRLKVIVVKNLSSKYFAHGYDTSLIFCPNCKSFIGWRFLVKNDFLSSSSRSFYGLAVNCVTSIDDHILPLVTVNDVVPHGSDREMIFDAVDDTDILLQTPWTYNL
ncbi:hypothetical protein AGLY_002319 [Aphis glycines]|uniref:CULT domain-containing protein n=1 Tax=Aphis glycines TaxID=307491 RepID=A0A6G0U4G9_APHGL|nr:hypothetical protein AGLY_002319 [Aphis glycines]